MSTRTDEASIELHCSDGRFTHCVTRGGGFIGDSISQNARRMQGFVPTVSAGFAGAVRGELVMPPSPRRSTYSDKASYRHAPTGLINCLSAGCPKQVFCRVRRWLDALFMIRARVRELVRSAGENVTSTVSNGTDYHCHQ